MARDNRVGRQVAGQLEAVLRFKRVNDHGNLVAVQRLCDSETRKTVPSNLHSSETVTRGRDFGKGFRSAYFRQYPLTRLTKRHIVGERILWRSQWRRLKPGETANDHRLSFQPPK